jgi:membrane protein DedA with SNARE-associated domain
MNIEHLIHTYGYVALLAGAFLEGETILIMAGFAAHRGYLDLSLVILIAAGATIFCDQVLYFMGKFYGLSLLEKRPLLKSRTHRFRTLLKKYQNVVIVGFRFMYGMRIVAPFVIGMSDISIPRFFILNVLSAFFWAATFTTGGYFFGSILELFIGNIKRYELAGLVIIAAAGTSFWLFYRYRNKA